MITNLFFRQLCLLLLTLNIYAQSSKKDEGIKMGFKGGLNVSNFLSSDIEEQSFRTSFHVGFLAEVIISDQVSFQPELLFSSQGNVGPETKQKYSYINVPLVLRYYVADQFSIDAGPQLGFLVDSFSRGNSGNESISDQTIFDLALGAGVTYELKNNLFFQGRYNLGLLNVNGADNSDTLKYQNSVIQLSVGYYF
jgi:hypothetical protein